MIHYFIILLFLYINNITSSIFINTLYKQIIKLKYKNNNIFMPISDKLYASDISVHLPRGPPLICP